MVFIKNHRFHLELYAYTLCMNPRATGFAIMPEVGPLFYIICQERERELHVVF